MKKLHRLVIKSFMGPMILTFFMVIFILLMQFLWKYIDDLVGKGLETRILGEFLLYSSASMVPMALPLAVLLASLMTFGNMAENLELLAFKSSGASLLRIMSPLIFVVSLVTLFAFFFANSVMPVANLQLRALLYDIQHQRPEMQIEPGIFDNTLEGYSIRIGDQNTKTSLLSDIWIYDHTDKAGNVSVTVADSGYMKISSDEKHLILTLFNGNSYVEMQKTKKRNQAKTYPHRRDHFVKQELLIEMTGFGLNRTDASIWKNSFSMMSLSQLTHFQDSFNIELNTLHKTVNKLVSGTTYTTPKRSMFMPTSKLDSAELADIVPAYVEINIDTAFSHMDKVEKRRAIQQAINTARSNKSFISSNGNTIKYKAHRLRRYEIEKHRKFTLSISCLIFFFIGAPLGAIIRKGGLGMPVIISVLFFLVWYIISITGEKFVREDIISAFSGMWLASFILIPLSIFLSYKAAHDSAILNIDSYLNFFKKGKEKIKNRISKL